MSLFHRIAHKTEVAKSVNRYCADCDHNLVRGDDPASGSFYAMWGERILSFDTPLTDSSLDELSRVVFAVCHQCSAEEEST